MLIFGEKINTVNKDVDRALANKDEAFFKNLVELQIKSGIVDVVDVNIGSDANIEPDNMKWAVDIVEGVTGGKIPLAIDSSNPKTIIEGIKKLKHKSNSYINSITLEEPKHKDLLPLAKKHDLNIVGLPIEGGGIPETLDERVKLSIKLAELVSSYDIDLSRLYIDCLIGPVSISQENAILALDTVRSIKKHIPEAKTIICLTAVSFGLPQRKLINRNFLTLLLKEEIDAIILDPLDDKLIKNLYATQLLTGKDEHCIKYLTYIKGLEK